jgi:C-terminal processing protease CtpA/Prc
MARSICISLLWSFTAVLASAPLSAQRVEVGGTRRAPRADPADANERALRRLERKADSLAQLYNENEELSAAQRHAVGEELDRTVTQIEEQTRRMSELDSRVVQLRIQATPMIGERSATAMGDVLRQALSQLAMPRGWMGVHLSGMARESRIENGEVIIHYLMHPVILSVDPSSPAEKAGLAPGDTVVAYDGQDVRDRDISITRLVRPDARVLVRIRRDGGTKEVPVTIADVPSRIRLRTEANFDLPRAIGSLPEGMVFPRRSPPVASMAPRAPGMRPTSALLPPRAPTPGMILSDGLSTVAGAQFAALTEGLARTVGVRRGVLVTYVGVGSPAYMSGLRDGDVIQQVGGEPVRTVAELREQVQLAVDNGESSVELSCVRDKKPRKVMLRWNDDR